MNENNGNKLLVANIDILDETPLLDNKPYVSIFDGVNQEKVGWLSNNLDEAKFKKI